MQPAREDASAYDEAESQQATRETTSYRRVKYGAYGQERTQYEDEAGDEELVQLYQKHRSVSRRSSTQYSTGPSSFKNFSSRPPHQGPSSDSHQRKPSLSLSGSGHAIRHSSKNSRYWKHDSRSGSYYHRHSDGRVSWFEGEEQDDEDELAA